MVMSCFSLMRHDLVEQVYNFVRDIFDVSYTPNTFSFIVSYISNLQWLIASQVSSLHFS